MCYNLPPRGRGRKSDAFALWIAVAKVPIRGADQDKSKVV
jgi:hypothetical protein